LRRRDPYVTGTDAACDGWAGFVPPSLPSFRAFDRLARGTIPFFDKTEAAGCPSQGPLMNKTPTRPNRRPKLFLPLFLAGPDAAREPRAFPLSPEQLSAAVAERIG
jgi:hypothetical protein